MKKFILLFSLTICAYNLNAQCDSTLPVSESFDNSSQVGVCWSFIDNDNDTYNWTVVDLNGNNGLASESRSSSTGAILYPDNWAITQAIDLTPYNTSSNIVLRWRVRTESWSFDKERYTVYAATGNQMTDFTSSPVNVFEDLDDSDASGAWANRSLDISSLAGNMVYIAFRHHLSAAQREIEVDDVQISSSTLSIDNLSESGFRHFYNKDTNNLTLESNTPMQFIEIYNILGQSILNKPLSKTEETIDLTNITKGAYLARINVENIYKTIKFIKH